MDTVKLVKFIETLQINETIEVHRVTTEDDEQIIGLPMFTSRKKGDTIKDLTVIMLYVPQEQTVMNIVDIETANAGSCTIEPSNKYLLQPEMQCLWDMHKEKIVELLNANNNDTICKNCSRKGI